jgi:DUF438 domain-containing protein
MEINHIAPEGHPVYTLMCEHEKLLNFGFDLVKTSEELKTASNSENDHPSLSKITNILDKFKESQKHYIREENVLFSYLEKHGITGPPSQMWTEHDQIRAFEKEISQLADEISTLSGDPKKSDFQEKTKSLIQKADELTTLLETHFYKENNILFPMALNSLTESEWENTINEFSEIGFCSFSPESAKKKLKKDIPKQGYQSTDSIDFGTGMLSFNELLSMLNRMPVEITFVDKDDTFRYFNQTKDPIFPRSTASIGRKVQNCHPEKSVHMVNKILNDFRNGRRDEYSFWIHLGEKYVYIRYFAVRDRDRNYLGSMEIVQDIKKIQEISGDKRLLD